MKKLVTKLVKVDEKNGKIKYVPIKEEVIIRKNNYKFAKKTEFDLTLKI